MQLSQVNYQPLDDMAHINKVVLKQLFGTVLGRLYAVLAIAVPLICLIVLPKAIVTAIFIDIIALVSLIGRGTKNVMQITWQNFAAANGWTVQPADINQAPPSLRGVGIARTQVAGPIINANFDGLLCDLFTFRYDVQAGKSRQTFFHVIVRVGLGKNFPRIVLVSQKNGSSLRILDTLKQLNLEGDFNKTFKLYIQQGEEIDVLSIITPDVMQTLLTADNQQDVEINNSDLFFINSANASLRDDPASMKSILQSVDSLAKEMVSRAQSLEYQPTTQPVVQPVAQPAAVQP